MFSEDYLMRMINLAVAALVRAIGLRKEGQYEKANQSIDQALEQLTGLSADILGQLDDQGVLNRLFTQEELDRERAVVVADLYFERGNIHSLQNQSEDACFCYNRALVIFLEVTLSDPEQTRTDQKDKIDSLFLATKECRLPFDTRFNLYSYYDSIGFYAAAEFNLSRLVHSSNFQNELVEEYKDFCRRLSEKPALDLEKGGLSSEQVIEMTRWIKTNQEDFN
jgi:tetratricopeptide (TPR) repeat protein